MKVFFSIPFSTLAVVRMLGSFLSSSAMLMFFAMHDSHAADLWFLATIIGCTATFVATVLSDRYDPECVASGRELLERFGSIVLFTFVGPPIFFSTLPVTIFVGVLVLMYHAIGFAVRWIVWALRWIDGNEAWPPKVTQRKR